MKLFLFMFHNADQQTVMRMSSNNLDISDEANKIKSVLSLMLHNSFTVEASDIFVWVKFYFHFLEKNSYIICPIRTANVIFV